jgi:hypothetical protein
MAEIIINERQLEIIQDLITKEENLKLAEQNWARFNDKEKEMVVEMMKVLYPKKAMLIKEDKWYNTLGDVVGIFDPTGVVDAINGISYIGQGDYLFGFLSFVSAIPYAGDLIAKPVMGALKIGAPSAKALNGVMKLSKAGKSAEAAAELAKISKSGGIVGSFVSGVGKYAGKLKDLVKRVPMPGGMKRTITQWIELFEKGAVKGKTVRYGAGVGEISKEICKVKKEKLIEKFESSEEGKGIRKLENLINERMVEVNVNLNKLKELKEVFENRELGGFGYGLLDLEVENGRFKNWEVVIKVGRDYNGGYSSSRNRINEEVEKELILEGLKGEFDLNELIKRMIEKFS